MAPAVTETHIRLKRIRRNLARKLAPQGQADRPVAENAKKDIRRVLIIRPVHSLGNLLGLTPVLTEIEAVLPEARVDILAGVPVLRDICRHYPQVNEIIILPRRAARHPFRLLSGLRRMRRQSYDLALDPSAWSSTARNLAALSGARHLIGTGAPGPLPEELDTLHFAHLPVNLLRHHLPWARSRQELPQPRLDLRLQAEERAQGRQKLQAIRGQYGLDRPRVLALFTHATWNKAYPAAWWRAFHSALKIHAEDYDFIEILPAHGESRLDFRLPTILSLDIRELGGILANCDGFVGADSGIAHLASASGIPTYSLFSVTEPEIWRPYGPDDQAVETTQMTPEEIAAAIHTELTRERVNIDR
jgi:heptosyltransferase-3